MIVLDLFSGIGGFSLGLEKLGFRTVAFCERDAFARSILARHWPGVPCYGDVREITARRLRQDGIARPDIVVGGFPCQPFSVAGKRQGKADERHLWPQFARIVRAVRPRWVIAENVPGIRNIAADELCGDLEAIGYTCRPLLVGAGHAGAAHRRRRAWFLASNPDRPRLAHRRPTGKQAQAACGQGPQLFAQPDGRGGPWWPALPDLGGAVDGVPAGLDRAAARARARQQVERLRCLGNAVVPQVVEMIGRAILHVESECAAHE